MFPRLMTLPIVAIRIKSEKVGELQCVSNCVKYRALKILFSLCGGLISSQLVVKIFGASWLLGGSGNPGTRGFLKMVRGNIAPPFFAIFVEGLEGKAIYFAPEFEFLGDFRSEEPLFQKTT